MNTWKMAVLAAGAMLLAGSPALASTMSGSVTQGPYGPLVSAGGTSGYASSSLDYAFSIGLPANTSFSLHEDEYLIIPMLVKTASSATIAPGGFGQASNDLTISDSNWGTDIEFAQDCESDSPDKCGSVPVSTTPFDFHFAFYGPYFGGPDTLQIASGEITMTAFTSGVGTAAWVDPIISFDPAFAAAHSDWTLNVEQLSLPPGGSATPEPASWALMIGGFGLAGAALRRRRGALALAL